MPNSNTPFLSKGPFGVAYAIPEGIPLATRLKSLYSGRIDRSDPLSELLNPDQRGEVDAWGGPHITLLDALTVTDLAEFIRIVQKICGQFTPPELTARGLSIWSKKSLVLRCESPGLEQVRAALIQATRHCIKRFPLSDEEIQQSRWWIEHRGQDRSNQLNDLDKALRVYENSGGPPLPSSRHFRLRFLVKLIKEIERANSAQRPGREGALKHYLVNGEPPWYASSGGLHLTLASGLIADQDFNQLKDRIWPSVSADFPVCSLSRIAILEEVLDLPVEVSFFDWLTEAPVREVRPSFGIREWVPFANSV